MARPKSNKPKYCLHKTSGRAFVRIADRQIWLGKYDSQESKDKYDAVVGQWINQGRPGAAPFVMPSAGGIMIIELVEAYWNFAKEYYKNDPMRSDGHRVSIRGALDLIVRLFGETPVAEFGPLKLAVVLAEMIKPRKVQAKRRVVDPETGRSEVKAVEIERPGWTRGYANSQLKRLKRMFAWGVTRELLPPHICQALEMVEGLRKGKTAARESQPVRPACEEDVRKVLPLLPPPVRAMIELESLTAMRPGEARIMRGQDIEIRKDVWIYRPQWHKTQHHGDEHVREIPLGPRAQEVLRPYMTTLDYLFTPKAADTWVREQKRKNRKTPMTPSQTRRAEEAAKRDRKFAACYSRNAFALCVRRACRKADLEKGFTPNMLRHTAGTLIRDKYGLDGAQVVLGHRHARITEVYAATRP